MLLYTVCNIGFMLNLTVESSREIEYVDQGEAYKNFINCAYSPVTKHNYRTGFRYFMKFCKATKYEGMFII
jgi:hypothetical protein